MRRTQEEQLHTCTGAEGASTMALVPKRPSKPAVERDNKTCSGKRQQNMQVKPMITTHHIPLQAFLQVKMVKLCDVAHANYTCLAPPEERDPSPTLSSQEL